MNLKAIFDQQILCGTVSNSLVKKMIEADQYDAASSMQWLGHVTSLVKEQVINEGVVVFELGNDKISEIKSIAQLKEFYSIHFPGAYACFLKST